jgi:pectate lyase-like protein
LLTITARSPAWPGDPASIINVKNFGALGNNVLNDGQAIQKAIGALKPGDTLYFPAGTYLVSGGEQLLLPPHIRVMGDGAGKSAVLFNEPVPVSGFGGFPFGWSDHAAVGVELDGMTFDYIGSGSGGQLVRAQNGFNITMHDVQIVGNALISLSVSGSDSVTIENSSIQGLGVTAMGTQNLFLDQVQFYESNFTEDAIAIWGAHNVSFTRCTGQNFDSSVAAGPSTTAQGRFIEYNLDWGPIYDQYIADNSTLNMSSPLPGNDGEQINIEGLAQAVVAKPLSATANTVTFPASPAIAPNFRFGLDVIVDLGAGVGQKRVVQSVAVNHDATGAVASVTLTLDTPWTIMPDSNSLITVGGTASRFVIYHNNLQDDPGPNGAAHLHASTGLCMFEGAYGLVYDSNTVQNVVYGLVITSTETNNPVFYVDVLNNNIVNAKHYGFDIGDSGPHSLLLNQNYIGVNVRDNSFDAPGQWGVSLAWGNIGSQTLTIIESNTINALYGIKVLSDPLVLIRKNNFVAPALDSGMSRYPQAVLYAPIASPTVLLRDNVYQGYAPSNKYFSLSPDAGLPASTLAAPYNVIGAAVQSGGSARVDLPLWSAGPGPVNWTGSTSVPWLTIDPPSGAVPDENTTGRASLVASAANLSAGNYSGQVTLVSIVDGKPVAKTFTVHLKVN